MAYSEPIRARPSYLGFFFSRLLLCSPLAMSSSLRLIGRLSRRSSYMLPFVMPSSFVQLASCPHWKSIGFNQHCDAIKNLLCRAFDIPFHPFL